jgi:hypothetical protein
MKEYKVRAEGEVLVQRSLIYYVNASSEEEAIEKVNSGKEIPEDYENVAEGDDVNVVAYEAVDIQEGWASEDEN